MSNLEFMDLKVNTLKPGQPIDPKNDIEGDFFGEMAATEIHILPEGAKGPNNTNEPASYFVIRSSIKNHRLRKSYYLHGLSYKMLKHILNKMDESRVVPKAPAKLKR